MNSKWEQARKNQLSILRFTVLLLFLFLAALMGILFGPVRSALIERDLHEFQTRSELVRNAVDSFLYQSSQIAAQIPSRTRIREELIVLREGKRSLESYITFARPKLEDAVLSSPEIAGVYRFQPDGFPITGAGLNKEEFPPLDFDPEKTLILSETGVIDDHPVFFIMLPITDPSFGLAGFDLVAISLKALNQTLQMASLATKGLKSVLFSEDEGLTPIANSGFTAYRFTDVEPIIRGVLPKPLNHKSQLRFSLQGVEQRGELYHITNHWYLLVARDEDELLHESIRQSRLFATVIFSLGIIALAFSILALRFLSGRTLAETEELSRLVDERTSEINLLVREVHHRVKNDLNMVQSFLAIRESQSNDPKIKEILHDAQGSILTMSKIYEYLYQAADDYSSVDLPFFARGLLQNLRTGLSGKELQLHTIVDEITCQRQKAIAIGIIINELVTNSLKYAGDETGIVDISLSIKKQEGNRLRIEVTDNGPGFPDAVLQGEKSFGLTMVNALAQQHGGSLSFANSPQPKVIIDIEI
jgi:two-component sensor histidine kinase